jgi:hypothetical protein
MEALGKRPWLLRGAVLGLALVVGLIALIASGGDDDDGGEEAAPVATESRIVEAGELADVAVSAGHFVYWAGPIDGTELELTESEDGSVQVRYLKSDDEAGTESAAALTIGTYPVPDPAAALDRFAGEPGSTTKTSPEGLEVVTSESSPNSAYFVSPDNSVQVEVYDPEPGRALELALSGRVRPAS